MANAKLQTDTINVLLQQKKKVSIKEALRVIEYLERLLK